MNSREKAVEEFKTKKMFYENDMRNENCYFKDDLLDKLSSLVNDSCRVIR